VGLATVCSIVTNGVLLKAGIPIDSRFGGILQVQNDKPVRFTEIIHYDGSSLDPSEIFIKARMTAINTLLLQEMGKSWPISGKYLQFVSLSPLK
jgi:repressor of nif and glnA expression